MQVIADDRLMSCKIVKDKGEYRVLIKVYNGTINEWSLGTDESIAKAKSATIVNTYIQALEEVQKGVIKAYNENQE